MTARERFRETVTRATHPRLLVLVGGGVAIGVLGTGLYLSGAGPRSTGARLAIVGYLVALVGGSGYVAFRFFERGFD